MKSKNRFVAAILSVAASGLVSSSPAFAEDVDVGKSEYQSACAACHGISGKGDGPAVGELKRKVPDLTVLARSNGGVFPFDKVYQIIDGRQEVKAHGSRDMPIWGSAFNRQSSRYFTQYLPGDSESAARSRILALTEYVYRLQAK